jgi:hypothetical protein
MKRGRKSAAELSIAPVVAVIPRPAAPDHLTDAEAQVWEAMVGSVEGGYFRATDHDQLANLCRHIVAARLISAWVERILSGEAEGEIDDIDKLLRMRQRETAQANALARSLRLTKQAQMHQRTAARAMLDVTGPKPWEM